MKLSAGPPAPVAPSAEIGTNPEESPTIKALQVQLLELNREHDRLVDHMGKHETK